MSEMADDEMGHMGMDSINSMDSMDESASNPDPNAVALGEPIELCSHCAMHSLTVLPAVSLREIEAPKRSGTFVIPDAVPQVISASMPYLGIFTSRAHGPPGQNLPRHVLINIFRI